MVLPSVHQTEGGAKDYVAAYCEEWWNEVGNKDDMPTDIAELIASYFEACNERYSITHCWVREGR